MEHFDEGSLRNYGRDKAVKFYYEIQIRKVGYINDKNKKDKNYLLGKKRLTEQKTNKVAIENLDRGGVYRIRYRVILRKNSIIKRTKWSGALVVKY